MKVLGKTEEVEWHRIVIRTTEEIRCNLKLLDFVLYSIRVNLLIVFQMDIIIYK